MSNCKGRMQDGIYNCFGEYNNCLCCYCIHSDDDTFEKTGNMFKSYVDAIDELFTLLKDKGLSDEVAYHIIWFLQEHLHVLPDNIEMCDGCHELYDADSEGFCLDDQHELNGKTLPKKYWGHWCGAGCAPMVDFRLK